MRQEIILTVDLECNFCRGTGFKKENYTIPDAIYFELNETRKVFCHCIKTKKIKKNVRKKTS